MRKCSQLVPEFIPSRNEITQKECKLLRKYIKFCVVFLKHYAATNINCMLYYLSLFFGCWNENLEWQLTTFLFCIWIIYTLSQFADVGASLTAAAAFLARSKWSRLSRAASSPRPFSAFCRSLPPGVAPSPESSPNQSAGGEEEDQLECSCINCQHR